MRNQPLRWGPAVLASTALALTTALACVEMSQPQPQAQPSAVDAGRSDASCGTCSCGDALAGRCVATCADVVAQRDKVTACARGVSGNADCAACATGELAGCSRCYDRCAGAIDTCVGSCTPKYPTCRSALGASVAVSSTEVCGEARLLFLAMGQCACRAGCSAMCPGFCSGGGDQDVAACSACFSEKYAGACATPYALCLGLAPDASAPSDAAPSDAAAPAEGGLSVDATSPQLDAASADGGT